MSREKDPLARYRKRSWWKRLLGLAQREEKRYQHARPERWEEKIRTEMSQNLQEQVNFLAGTLEETFSKNLPPSKNSSPAIHRLAEILFETAIPVQKYRQIIGQIQTRLKSGVSLDPEEMQEIVNQVTRQRP